jgi:glycosyltransferase involved in cell wall biosynthesis
MKVVPPVFADMYAFRHDPEVGKVQKQPSPELLVVGRVVPHKRIEDAIAILPGIRELGMNAVLSVVGSMPNSEYFKYLINYARKLSVLDFVNFEGMLDDDDLLDCFRRTAVLLTMSRHEGFCVPVLEAMCHGKPVLVRAGTAAEELCPADRVIPADAPTSAWTMAVHRLLKASDRERAALEADYRSRANDILSMTSDDVWHGLLTQGAR